MTMTGKARYNAPPLVVWEPEIIGSMVGSFETYVYSIQKFSFTIYCADSSKDV